MKKILLIILLIIVLPAVLWLSSTWYISQQTETLFEQQLAFHTTQLQQSSPQAKLEKTHYEKRLLGATAKTHLILPLQNATADVLELDFNHQITHGPIFWENNSLSWGSTYWYTTLDTESLPAEQQAFVQRLFKQQEPVKIYTTTGFGKTVESTLDLAPLAWEENGESLELEGVYIENKNIMSEPTQVTLNAEIGNMRLSSAELDIVIPASALKASMLAQMNSVMTGDIDWQVSDIQFKAPQAPVAKFSARYQAELADKEGLLEGSGRLALKDINIPNGYPIDNAHYDVFISGLNIAGFQAFQVALNEFNSVNMQMIEELSTEEASKSLEYYQEVIATYEPALQEREAQVVKALNMMLVPGQSQLKLDLGVADPEAKASALLKIDYAESAASQGLNFAVSDPQAIYKLLRVFNIDLALEADKKLLALTPFINEVVPLVQQGFVQQQGNSYTLTALMQQGQLVLNGRPFPLEALMMMQAMQEPNPEEAQGEFLPEVEPSDAPVFPAAPTD